MTCNIKEYINIPFTTDFQTYKNSKWESEFDMHSGGYTEPVPGLGDIFIYYHHSPIIATVIGLSATPTEHSFSLYDGEIVDTIAEHEELRNQFGIYRNPITGKMTAMNLHLVSDFTAVIDPEQQIPGFTIQPRIELNPLIYNFFTKPKTSGVHDIKELSDFFNPITQNYKENSAVINLDDLVEEYKNGALKTIYWNILKIAHDLTMLTHVLPCIDWVDYNNSQNHF